MSAVPKEHGAVNKPALNSLSVEAQRSLHRFPLVDQKWRTERPQRGREDLWQKGRSINLLFTSDNLSFVQVINGNQDKCISNKFIEKDTTNQMDGSLSRDNVTEHNGSARLTPPPISHLQARFPTNS